MSSRRTTSTMGEIRAANPDLDVPLTWLQHRNPHKTYYPGYVDEDDVKGLTFSKASERLRRGVDKAIDNSILGEKDGETRYRAANVPEFQRSLRAEEELITQRETHAPTCMFEMPDLAGMDVESIHHPNMEETALRALQQTTAYRCIWQASLELNRAMSTETWLPSDFEQWFDAKCALPSVVHREKSPDMIRLVHRLDSGWRFFVLWMLPRVPHSETRVFKQVGILFFSCKCTIMRENDKEN